MTLNELVVQCFVSDIIWCFYPFFVVPVFPSRKWRTSRSWASSVKTSLTLSPPKCPLTWTRKSRLSWYQVCLRSRWEVEFHTRWTSCFQLFNHNCDIFLKCWLLFLSVSFLHDLIPNLTFICGKITTIGREKHIKLLLQLRKCSVVHISTHTFLHFYSQSAKSTRPQCHLHVV